jgi:hypothetical protein
MNSAHLREADLTFLNKYRVTGNRYTNWLTMHSAYFEVECGSVSTMPVVDIGYVAILLVERYYFSVLWSFQHLPRYKNKLCVTVLDDEPCR